MRPNALAAAQVNQSNGTGRAPAKPLVQGSGGALIQAAPEQDKENATARPRDTPHVGPAATQHAPAAATPAPRAVSAELALPPGAHLSVGSLAVPLPVTTERVLTLLRVSSPGSLGSDPHDPNSTDRVPFEVHIPASYTDMSPELSDAVHAHAQHLARGIGGASPVTPVLEDVVVNVAPRLFADPWAAGRDAPPGSRGRMVVQLPSEFGHSADQVSAWKQGDVVGCRLFQRPFTQDTRLARTVALQPGTQHRVMTGLCCTVSLVFDLRSAQDEAARAAPARIQAEEEQPAPQTGGASLATTYEDFYDLFLVFEKTIQKMRAAFESAQTDDGFALSQWQRLSDIQGAGEAAGVRVGDVNVQLPITSETLAALDAVAEVAPCGKGMDTLVDQSVRRAQKIDGDQITLSAPLQRSVDDAATRLSARLLGVDCPVRASLWQMCLYSPGGHFVEHRDTEKEAGMFGTMVVQLPTEAGHEGGRLIVRHGDVEHAFFGPAPPGAQCVSLCAFFADCLHRLTPVTAGRRVVLAFNLVRDKTQTHAQPSGGSLANFGAGASARVARRLHPKLSVAAAAWRARWAEEGYSRMVVPLGHMYTELNWPKTVEDLKGNDADVARMLLACDDLDVAVGFFQCVERGVPSGEPGRKKAKKQWYDYYSDEECEGKNIVTGPLAEAMEFEEWLDGEWTNKWTSLRDGATWHDRRAVDDEELQQLPGASGAVDFLGKCVEATYTGYQGNWGPDLERVYRRAALEVRPIGTRPENQGEAKGRMDQWKAWLGTRFE